MYEHFNPLNLENAWLQHLILFAVAGVLGYIIGYQRSKIRLNDYLGHLARLEADLAQCFKTKAQPAAAPVAKPAKAAEPVPSGEELLRELEEKAQEPIESNPAATTFHSAYAASASVPVLQVSSEPETPDEPSAPAAKGGEGV